MPNILKIKRKTTTGNPSAGVLAEGELVWNEVDEKLLIKSLGIVKVVNPTALGGGGSTTFTTVEKNLGSVPRYQGEFTINGSGYTVGRPVLIAQASGPYTGKGKLADEGLDMVIVNAYVLNTTTIKAFYQAVRSPLKGNIKFNFAIL